MYPGEGEDYIANVSALSFLPGSLRGSLACLDISLIEDSTVEGDEIFCLPRCG